MPASNLGAGRHDVLYTALILLYMELEHTLLCGDVIYFLDVDLPQVLNVYGAALQHSHLPLHQSNCGRKEYCMRGTKLNDGAGYQVYAGVDEPEIGQCTSTKGCRKTRTHHLVCLVVTLWVQRDDGISFLKHKLVKCVSAKFLAPLNMCHEHGLGF